MEVGNSHLPKSNKNDMTKDQSDKAIEAFGYAFGECDKRIYHKPVITGADRIECSKCGLGIDYGLYIELRCAISDLKFIVSRTTDENYVVPGAEWVESELGYWIPKR